MTEAADGWQPIETGPRDGTVVDLWVKGKRMADCYWSFARNDKGKRVDDPVWDGWCCDTGKPGPSGFNPYPNLINGKPTHWRPVPGRPQ